MMNLLDVSMDKAIEQTNTQWGGYVGVRRFTRATLVGGNELKEHVDPEEGTKRDLTHEYCFQAFNAVLGRMHDSCWQEQETH